MWKQKKVMLESKLLPRINDMGLYKAYKQLCKRNDAKQIGNRISDEERAEIIRLHNEGWPQTEIVRRTERSAMTIHKLLQDEGLLTGRHGNRRRDITVEDVCKMKAEGLCINHIAARLGCSEHLVSDRLKAAKKEATEK